MDEHRATKTSAEVHDTGSGEASTGPEEAAKQPDLERRTLLASVLAVTATSLIPTVRAAAAVAADQDSFIAVSKILTGQTTLDPGQATRLYDALLADNPEFVANLQALLALISQQRIEPLNLQQALDSEHSTVASLPRKIVTAWYTGVVGEGEKARCVAFETSLMNVIVRDKLKPPSYCHGAYGSWVEKP